MTITTNSGRPDAYASAAEKAPRSGGLSELDRKRISWLRLVLVLALVFLHYGAVYGTTYSPYRGYMGQDLPVASILVSFILFVGFTAVPAMSAISGYLFFLGSSRDKAPDFMSKIRRRGQSLALPFLLWSSFFAALAFIIYVQWPGSAIGSDFAGEFSTEKRGAIRVFADAVFAFRRPPVAFQLWFVHDLILTVLISPIIWVLVGRAPLLTIAILVPLWIMNFNFWIFLRLDVLVFFCFGAACAMHGYRPDLPKRWILPVFGVFLALVLARTLAPYFLGRANGLDIEIFTASMRIVGAIAIWNVASLLLTGAFAAWVLRNSYMAFFIHCAHYPPILFIKLGLGSFIDPMSEIQQIVLYFSTVLITILSLVWLGNYLGYHTPKFFRVISGGRVRPGAEPEASGFLPTR